MNKEKIINNISFFVGIVTVLLAYYFKDNIVIACLIVGIGATLYGIGAAINKNTYGYLFISVGLSLALALAFYKYDILNKNDAVTFMLCTSVFLLMFITFIFMYLNKKNVEKNFKLVVDAKVIDLVKNPNTNKEYYQVIYEYEIEDKVYCVGSPGFVDKFIPKIGDTCRIYVDENDYENVFFDKKLTDKIYNIGLSLFLMIVSLIIVISLFF